MLGVRFSSLKLLASRAGSLASAAAAKWPELYAAEAAFANEPAADSANRPAAAELGGIPGTKHEA